MSALTFEPFDEQGRPRVLAGMFRPPFDSLTSDERRSLIPSFKITSYVGEDRDAWLRGGLDRPVYFEDVVYHRPDDQGLQPIETERAP